MWGKSCYHAAAATKYACLLYFSTTICLNCTVQNSLLLYAIQISSDISQYSSISPIHPAMDADLHHCHVLRTFLIVLVCECICNTGWKGFIQASRPRVILQLSPRYFMLQHRLRALTNQDISCSILTRTPSRENNPPKTVILDYPRAPTNAR